MRNRQSKIKYSSALTIVGTGLLFFSRSFINADTADTLTSNKANFILILSVVGVCSLLVGLLTLILAFVSKK